MPSPGRARCRCRAGASASRAGTRCWRWATTTGGAGSSCATRGAPAGAGRDTSRCPTRISSRRTWRTTSGRSGSSNEAASPLERVLQIEGVRDGEEHAAQPVLHVAAEQRGLDAVVAVDDQHAAQRDGVPRPGDPVRVDDETIVHLDVAPDQGAPGVGGAEEPGVQPDAAQLDVAMMGAELLVLDLPVVERLASARK